MSKIISLHRTFRRGGVCAVASSSVQTNMCIHASHYQALKSPLFVILDNKNPFHRPIIYINEWLISLYDKKCPFLNKAIVLTVSNIFHLHRTFRGRGVGVNVLLLPPPQVRPKRASMLVIAKLENRFFSQILDNKNTLFNVIWRNVFVGTEEGATSPHLTTPTPH